MQNTILEIIIIIIRVIIILAAFLLVTIMGLTHMVLQDQIGQKALQGQDIYVPNWLAPDMTKLNELAQKRPQSFVKPKM